MRRWLLYGALLALAGGIVAAVVVARLNAYLAGQRAALAARASAALGRPVSFATLRVSWRGGGSVRVTDLHVADDPRRGGGLLSADSALATVSLLDALRGRWRVDDVLIDAPRLTLVADAEGWNVATLAPLRAAPAPSPVAAAGAPAPSATSAPAPAAAAPPLHVAAVRLRDGRVAISDRQHQPPLSLTLEHIDVRLAQPEPRDPVQVRGSAALAGADGATIAADGVITPGTPPRADVHLTWKPIPLAAVAALSRFAPGLVSGGSLGGDLRFNGPIDTIEAPALLAGLTGALTLHDVALRLPAIEAPLSTLSGTLQFGGEAIALRATTARLAGAPLAIDCRAARPAAATAQCRVTAAALDLAPLAQIDATLAGVTLDATAPLRDADPILRLAVAIDEIQWRGAPLRQARAEGTLQRRALEITQATARVFGGSAHATGRCADLDGPTPQCSVQLGVDDARVGPALAAVTGQAQRVDGRVGGELRVTARGRDPIAARRSLRGTGSVWMRDGVVQGLNLAQRVLGALPGIDTVVRRTGRASRLLGDGATRFERLSATVRIAEERVASDDLTLIADDFTVDARGSLRFDGALTGRGLFRGAAPLVDDLSRGIPVLGSLMASTTGLVTVPFSVSGTVEDPRLDPDLSGVVSGLGREVNAGIQTLFGDPRRGAPGGALRRPLDQLLGR